MRRLGIQKNHNLMFAVLEACYWASNGALYAFTVTILSAYGYGSALCGLATTGIAVASVGAQFALGYVTDTFIPSKRVLMVLMAVASGLSLLLPRAMQLPPALAIACIVGISFIDYSLYTTIDVWAVRSEQNHPEIDFAVVRSGGSLGYALVSLVMGALAARFSVDLFFYAHSVMLAVSFFCCIPLQELPCRNKRRTGQQNAEKSMSLGEVCRELAHNGRYVRFIATIVLMQFSFRLTVTYLPILITNAGGDSGHLGIALFFESSMEAVVMILASRLIQNGVPPSYVLIGGLCCGVIRMVTLFFDSNVWLLVGLHLFQALAVGAYLRVYTEYISRITPPNMTASATTIGTAFTMGVGGMMGNLLGGVIIEQWGIHFYMGLSAGVMVLAALVFLPTVLTARKQVANLRRKAYENAM